MTTPTDKPLPQETTIWLVYSNEHGAWWRPNSAGYTKHVESAGRYSKAEADYICRDASRGPKRFEEDPPHEVAVIAPEAYGHFTRAARPADTDTQALAESIVRHLAQFKDRLTHGFEGHVGAVARLIDAARPADSADMRRLDWLQQNGGQLTARAEAFEPSDATRGCFWEYETFDDLFRGPNIRAAIDAALAQPASADVAPAVTSSFNRIQPNEEPVERPPLQACIYRTGCTQLAACMKEMRCLSPVDVAPAPQGEPDYLYSKCCHFGVTTISGQAYCIHCAKPCETYRSSRRATPSASAETPRTDAKSFMVKINCGEIVNLTDPEGEYTLSDFARTLEHELTALHASRSQDWIFIAAASQLRADLTAVKAALADKDELIFKLTAQRDGFKHSNESFEELYGNANAKLAEAVAEVERLKVVIHEIYLYCENYVDGAPDAGPFAKHCNSICGMIPERLRAAAKPTP